jgi:hypothetical protein
MAIKNTIKIFSILAFFSMFSILLPAKTFAATLTKTTVYVNINKASILGHQFDTGLQNKFKVTISKGNLTYETTTGTDDGGYLKYSKSISRCNSANVDQSGWTIKIASTATNILYIKTISSATLCGNPIYTIKADGTLYKDAGRSCNSCPTEPQGPLLNVTGVLKRVTGNNLPPEDRVYYIDPSSGNNLSLGTNLSKWTWDPANTHNTGSTYSCNYMEPRNNPTQVSCKAGSTPPPQRSNPADPADPADPGDTGGDSGTTTTPSEPLEIGFGETVDVDTDLSSTKGCGADGKYTSGILKGVSCTGATKTKEEVVQIIKNIIEDFLLPTVGVIFVTVIVLGGLVYITSGGNEESVKRGKKILTSGIIGFLIVTLSYTLIRIFVAILGGNIV